MGRIRDLADIATVGLIAGGAYFGYRFIKGLGLEFKLPEAEYWEGDPEPGTSDLFNGETGPKTVDEIQVWRDTVKEVFDEWKQEPSAIAAYEGPTGLQVGHYETTQRVIDTALASLLEREPILEDPGYDIRLATARATMMEREPLDY